MEQVFKRLRSVLPTRIYSSKTSTLVNTGKEERESENDAHSVLRKLVESIPESKLEDLVATLALVPASESSTSTCKSVHLDFSEFGEVGSFKKIYRASSSKNLALTITFPK
jgi:hypothetical protein